MTTIMVTRHLAADSRSRAADLYWEAFGRKLGPALGPPAKGTAFLAEHLNPDRAVCAVADGQLVGLAGYQHADRGLLGGDASDVLRAYGLLSGTVCLALLVILERHAAPDELVMDGIAVDPTRRGRGIGGLLLTEVLGVAR